MSEDIAALLEARPRDLGGFAVGRVLPAINHRMVGPFIFFDHMGPADVEEMVVRPHPHINLATVTYLFRGEILHRDTLGSKQAIQPGAINWMSAGRGIAHSERIAKDGAKHPLHGLQLWVALPKANEETDPRFDHHPADSLPSTKDSDASLRVLLGKVHGAQSPVKTVSPIFYCDVALDPDAKMALPSEYSERALYVIEGAVFVGGQRVEPRQMAIIEKGSSPTIQADGPTRLVMLGGEPLDGPRYIWWNFVSSEPDRIHEAAERWRARKWDTVYDDTVEFTPAPDDKPNFRPAHS
ncbi:MAG: pirin family protein [Kofleriaceae bacterium]